MPSSQKQEMDKQDTFYKALARMAVKRAEGKKTRKNITHFFLLNKKNAVTSYQKSINECLIKLLCLSSGLSSVGHDALCS